ncbi:Serine/threonine-protein kinase PknB [Caulifigura coniformis]|uniref:non-specific serine/threonine protein kinase n=1 Tax=Caulifigura coniformis TaxID=2527983 RepID=A0A517SAA8_9PLAN|nr:serine/threonine-protein kinase [Caulifigura coniformis]QDT53052.1 Serine/threonine-protein kinase PknB [Caulifigura coniformis]
MSADPRLNELLEEILETGCSPEVATRDCPELLPELLTRLRHVHAVEAQVEALFPDSGISFSPAPERPQTDELPLIPGYEVLSVLGRGGMGVVYKGRHLQLNRSVAIKMPLVGTHATQAERERFHREAEAAARLQHPGLVPVYDVGEHRGRLYFTMEFVDGGSLAEKLGGTPQPSRAAAELLVTLSDAVHAAHEKGIVHRDLKPSNILLTSDGRPKISDFGLARQTENAAGLTLSGMPVGTPSYMSPEQARGDSHLLGPSVDVYALGALLYELLTGRPPFHADSSQATLTQVMTQEAVPPTQLNRGIPSDLETICLKCLQKTPRDRYATAADLRDDVRRFLRNEPIVARPVGPAGRMVRWIRRNPAWAALLATSVLFSATLATAVLRNALQEADRRNEIERELRQIGDFQQQGRWNDARVYMQKLEDPIRGSGVEDLQKRISTIHDDLDLVGKLDRIHLNRATSAGDLAHYKSKADRQYVEALEGAGLTNEDEESEVVAARVKASAVRLALIAAIDDWAMCASDRTRREWLLRIVRDADPDPHGWKDRIRDPVKWDSREALAALATEVPVTGQPVSLLLTLGERLRDANIVPTEFLTRVQHEYPSDFWANIALGDAILWASPVEAAGYFRAALASRSNAAVAYTALGDSLRIQKRYAEARSYYEHALELDPVYARGQSSLGNLLRESGHLDEAIKYLRIALDLDPHYAYAHLDLANALRDSGRNEEALEHFREIHAVNQSIPYVENTLRSESIRLGKSAEVLRDWKAILANDPPQHVRWFGYAELCLFLGDEQEYRRACSDLIRRFRDTDDPYVAEPVARAILLAPPSEEVLRVASELADRAVDSEPTRFGWVFPYFQFAKGLAEYRQGNFSEAVSILSGPAANVLGPCPGLVTAMARSRLGDQQAARLALANEISAFNWSFAKVRGHDQWLWHVLRHEAESVIVPEMAAFFEGQYEPQDNIDRLILLGECRFKNHTARAARLYADAFAADSALAEAPRSDHLFNAARIAALAGCGEGEDASGLSEDDRQKWRSQARTWLRAELSMRAAGMNPKLESSRENVRRKIVRWRTDAELAGLREPAELQKLSPAERDDSLALWSEVEALLRRCDSR